MRSARSPLPQPQAGAAALRVVIAGGGTGGHVTPAIALADAICAWLPGSQVRFIGCSGGLEERLVPASGYQLELLRVGKLQGTGVLGRLRTLAALPPAVLQVAQRLRRLAPDVVVGVGGYASGPALLAALPLRLPVVLLEQNSVPGLTNRVLARLADRIVIAFRGAARHLPPGRTLLLGNPVRLELHAALARGQRPERDREAKPALTLLVLGGSQGAHALNELVTAAAPALAAAIPGLRLLHQTGADDEAWVRQRYAGAGVCAEVLPFIDDMAAAYLRADLVVGRAGATTLAELCLAGLPAILVPYPFAADDHQTKNAAELVAAGGAVLVQQRELSGASLADLAAQLLGDRARLAQMGAAMRRAAHPEAATAIVRLLLEVSGRRAQGQRSEQ